MGKSSNFQPNRREDAQWLLWTIFYAQNCLFGTSKPPNYVVLRSMAQYMYTNPTSEKIFVCRFVIKKLKTPPELIEFYQCWKSFVFYHTPLQQKLKVFLFQKTSSAYSKIPILLFSDVWSVHWLIGTKIWKNEGSM